MKKKISLYSAFGVLGASEAMKLKLEFVSFELVRPENKIWYLI